MDAVDLRFFETVARTGRITSAAQELNTVQSNVTGRIRLLERGLGVELFHRHSRGVALSRAGQQLLPYAHKIGHLLEEAKRAVLDDGVPRGPLSLGSLETIAALRLPPLLVAYNQEHPDVDVSLITGTAEVLTNAVIERRVEGAFVVGPIRHPDLLEKRAFREELVLISAPRHRSLSSLLNSTDELKALVFRTGCSYRRRCEQVLASRGLTKVKLVEFGTLEGIIGCVGAGIGIAMLPKSVVARYAQNGSVAVHKLAKNEALVQIVFIYRKDAYVSSALRLFLQAIR